MLQQAYWWVFTLLCVRMETKAHHSFLIGYGGYSKPGWGHGVRTFLFSLKNLTTSVASWVTMEDGSRIDEVTLDASYGVN